MMRRAAFLHRLGLCFAQTRDSLMIRRRILAYLACAPVLTALVLADRAGHGQQKTGPEEVPISQSPFLFGTQLDSNVAVTVFRMSPTSGPSWWAVVSWNNGATLVIRLHEREVVREAEFLPLRAEIPRVLRTTIEGNERRATTGLGNYSVQRFNILPPLPNDRSLDRKSVV